MWCVISDHPFIMSVVGMVMTDDKVTNVTF